MQRVFPILIATAAAILPPPASCRAAGALTTAPVDYSLYREGEVRRVENRYAGWLLTCDEIKRLAQKFCSLRTVARSSDGTVVAAMTVSTDDRGLPAAIVTLPYGASLQSGVNVAYASTSGRRNAAPRLTPKPARCDNLGCQIVWLLEPGDIRELRSGRALRLSFHMSARRPSFPSLSSPLKTVAGLVEATGFSDALAASMH